MYRYDEFDERFVRERVAQFRHQVTRRLANDLSEDQFKPLRLMNGLYLQLHAYMLRVAIPYGTLSSRQLHKLAHIARTYDKGYGHFTTRQNIQYNWPELEDVPEILDELADVQMHAIQTSGNCIRNVTADHLAGAAADEIADPRPYAEIIRQWSSLHPEFSYLPRKFKIAVNGSPVDRAAIKFHDIGIQIVRDGEGALGFTIYVGGGMGRTPMIAKVMRAFLPEQHLLAYLEAIMRVYNRHGRRDNKYKARIKILLHEEGEDRIRAQVEREFDAIKGGVLDLPSEERARIAAYFAPPDFADLPAHSETFSTARADHPDFASWAGRNVHEHARAGYASVTISLKSVGAIPGDATAAQMDAVADLAKAYSFDELRVSHEQNLILPHVARDDLPAVFEALAKAGLAEANAGLISDIIACPGLDFCSLATARSIPIAQQIATTFAAQDRQETIGDLKIKISGCINACGHHHAGHIGILGLDRKGEEFYQITLGGSADEETSVGKIIGPGFPAAKVPGAIETLVETYLAMRNGAEETFLQTYRRVGEKPFKQALYEGAR